MEDTGTYPKPQRLGAAVPQKHANASKSYYHILFKAVIVTIVLVIIPIFSSQTPNFVNQNFHTSLELLQLVFVGIAVSYGLFSKRTEEPDKEHSPIFDSAQSYISRLIQVSSVFDDEAEAPAFNDSKTQIWNSQCYRGEPVVVVAEESSVHQEQRETSSLIGEKPLLLPIRSLKSRVSDSGLSEPTQDNSVRTASLSRSITYSGSNGFSSYANISINKEPKIMSPLHLEHDVEQTVIQRSGSKLFSSSAKQSRNGELGGESPPKTEEVETAAHRSQIPWRTRLGRMEMKQGMVGPSQHKISTSTDDPESGRLNSHSFRSLSSHSSTVNLDSPLPDKLSPSPSLTSPRKLSPSHSRTVESQAKGIEDFVKMKSSNKSSPPPPPPPPFFHRFPVAKSSSSMMNGEVTLKKELRRSVKSVPTEPSNKREELPRRANSMPEFRSENVFDASVMGRSVRTIRPSEELDRNMRANKFDDDFIDGERENWSTEIEEDFDDKRECTNKLMQGKFPSMSWQTIMEFPEYEKEEFTGKVLVDTKEDSGTESEVDFFEGSTSNEEETSSSKEEPATDSISDGGPDVDKKADEFIAKFREQIRQQRIESIRRSTVQHTKSRSR